MPHCTCETYVLLPRLAVFLWALLSDHYYYLSLYLHTEKMKLKKTQNIVLQHKKVVWFQMQSIIREKVHTEIDRSTYIGTHIPRDTMGATLKNIYNSNKKSVQNKEKRWDRYIFYVC